MKSINLSSEDLQKKADLFLSELFSDSADLGLKLEPHWDIDHLCFRVDTLDAYELYKETLANLGTLLTESHVNGRPIATFELNYPIRFQNWIIRIIELPAPKKGKMCKTGFEHIEIVVDKPLLSLADEYPKFKWDKSGLIKLFNSELELPVGDSAIKFHNISLKSVINFELRPKFAMLVTELNLFEIFKDKNPFIAGSIPLAIDVSGSEIDFLVSYQNGFDFKSKCTELFGGLPGFEMSQGHANGADYSLCRFNHHEIPFQIFSSVGSTYSQNGFLHFQIEEKLLKYGAINWHNDIINLKSSGLKTEPAFAKLINQDAVDPYLYLLELQKKSIRQLRETIQTATLLN